MPVLVVKTPGQAPVAYEVTGSGSMTIGRSAMNEICVNDHAISAVHARVRFEDDEYFLDDLGSANGTYYEGRYVTTAPLHPGGQIYIGTTSIEFQSQTDVALVTADEAALARKSLLVALEGIDADTEWLAPVLFQRAAKCYEVAGLWHEAAGCWLEAGKTRDAIDIYLKTNQYERAAPLLMEQERYAEALHCYRVWLAGLKREDPVSRVNALLGVALSLKLMKAEPKAADNAYRQARSLVETKAGADSLTAGACWERLAAYGAKIGRTDLVQVAYEESLNAYGSEYNDERLRIGWDYLAAVPNNRLLVAEIEAKLAEWAPDVLEAASTSAEAPILSMGARFGDWTIWRPGPKEILLIHAESSTGIQIWGDSWGWFKWSGSDRAGRIVRTDGSITETGPVGIKPYVDRVPEAKLSQVSGDVVNYSISWSNESLQIFNKVKGATIVIGPNSSGFTFRAADGRSLPIH